MATIPSYYEGLLSEDDMSSLRNQALASGLLSAGAAFSRAGAPSLMPQGSGFSDALQGFNQGYQGQVDSALQNMLKATQVQELVRKQKQAQQLNQLYQSAYTPGKQTAIPSEVGPAVVEAPGTFDMAKIIPQLQTQFGAEGIGYLKDLAESTTALRKAGFMGGGQAPSPFAPYLDSPSPRVKTLAMQLEQGLKSGAIDEATAYNRIEPLAKMEESFINTRIAAGERADRLAQDKKPTEGEKKTATLAGRLEGALSDLKGATTAAQTPEYFPSLLQGKLTQYIPGSDILASKLTSSERAKAEAAQLDALDAALTLGTGAAYTSEQLKGYAKAYFPQIGNDDATIKDKNARFSRLVALAREQAGTAAKSIDIAREKAKPFDIKDFKKNQGLE